MLVLALFLLNTSRTDADLFAERIVRSNHFSATTLSFSQRHTANNSYINQLFRTINIQPEGFDLGAVRIKKDGKLNFKYRLKTIKTNGDNSFCQALTLDVMQKGIYKYQGKLMDFIFDSNINDSQPQDWIFFIGLTDDNISLKNKTCEFNFYFKTWRNDPESKKGFYAERSLYNIISSGSWN
jgi:hypothetical protein